MRKQTQKWMMIFIISVLVIKGIQYSLFPSGNVFLEGVLLLLSIIAAIIGQIELVYLYKTHLNSHYKIKIIVASIFIWLLLILVAPTPFD